MPIFAHTETTFLVCHGARCDMSLSGAQAPLRAVRFQPANSEDAHGKDGAAEWSQPIPRRTAGGHHSLPAGLAWAAHTK